MLKIRLSTPQDGDRVMQIWRSSVDATHDFLSIQDRIEIEQELQDFLPNAPLWLAVNTDDFALGFMLLDGSQMHALFIDADARGIGVGKTLVQHALSLNSHLTTDVNEQNSQAVGFYQHMGFAVIGRSEIDGQGRNYPLLHLKYSDSA